MVKKGKIKGEHNYVQKNISITKEQEEYILNNCINLSRLVQKKLNEEIENGKSDWRGSWWNG